MSMNPTPSSPRARLFAYGTAGLLVAAACGGSVQLQGDQDGLDADLDAPAEVIDALDTSDRFDLPDSPDEWEAGDEGGAGEDDGDGGAEDGPEDSAPPDSWDVVEVVVPDERERFVTPASGEAVGLHRSAMPTAFSGSVYGLLLEAADATGTPGPLAAYILDPDAGSLAAAWIDDAPATTDYNSICWSGSAFVAALPTPGVGVRLLGFGADGSIVSGPSVLDADADYSPAGEGFPPVLACPGTAPVFIDRGRGAGGRDRIYSLRADGTYSGTHADLDLPAIVTNMFLATSPCIGTTSETACATHAGLVFATPGGTVYSSDAIHPVPPCTDVYGCDVSWDGVALVVAGEPLAGSSRELRFARFTGTGGLLLPTLVVPDPIPEDSFGLRIASSGEVLAILTGTSDAGMSGATATLHVLDAGGSWLAPALPAAACSSPGGACGFHIYGGGASIFWDGEKFVALWVTDLDPAVAIRAFRVVP